MTNPKILITSPIRYRPDAPGAWCVAFESWNEAARDYAGEVSFCGVLHQAGGRQGPWDPREAANPPYQHMPFSLENITIPSPQDSRTLGGPRSTGETQEVLAFLRNRLFRAFQQSDADLCLMVDSDVVLAPGALRRMVDMDSWPTVKDGKVTASPPRTVSLQIDNRIAEEHEPHTNAMWDNAGRMSRVPWSDDGLTVRVHRAGACTLYPRAALERRFRWDPRYQDEQDALFDDLRELGFEHFLIRDPKLAEHRMKRRSLFEGHDAEERCRCEYIQVEAGYLQHTEMDSLTPKPCRAGDGKVWPKPQPPCI